MSTSWVCTLTAEGHEPFEHRCSAGSGTAAAQFTAEVWLLGHPERRVAKNISVSAKAAL